jgi:hypothetical protein
LDNPLLPQAALQLDATVRHLESTLVLVERLLHQPHVFAVRAQAGLLRPPPNVVRFVALEQ